MCLKSDYYSGLGTNMHAAYNVQILVVDGIVLSYLVSQSRNDMNDFIPTLDKFYEYYRKFPQNICADAGYGSKYNYQYLKDKGMVSYVKHQSWEGNVSGKNPTCYRMNKDKETITCLGGKKGVQVNIEGRHPKKEGGRFFKVEGCNECGYKKFCFRFTKDLDSNVKILEINPEYQLLIQDSKNNLLSRKGIEIRVNRSIQIEGVFGNEKYNQGYERIRRIGINNVNVEIMLTLLGLNLRKLFKYYKTNEKQKKWKLDESVEAENFKKPSAKRLSNKGENLMLNFLKIKQAQIV